MSQEILDIRNTGTPVASRPRIEMPLSQGRDAARGAAEQPVADPDLAVARAVEAAADIMFPAHEVKVTSFRDEPTGRLVFRVTDDRSGEVLMQSPPDELLRFYASGRQDGDKPLLQVRA